MPLANAQEYSLWLNATIFLVAAIVVWGAGTRLTRDLDGVAQKTGLGEAFVGMLLLGTITSLPEIANVTTSAWNGNPALAVNNLLGSASINILLLAVADAFIGRDAVTSAVLAPATMMMSVLCLLVLLTVAMAIVVSDFEVLGIGLWALVLCTMSVGSFWLAVGYNARTPWTLKDDAKHVGDEGEEDTHEGESLRSLVLKTAMSGAAIFVAGYALSQTGDALAKQAGIGTGMVGFALIGLSTSLPELSSIVAALRLRRYEMAFGQVLGTNFVNLSLILLADVVYREGPVINKVGRFETVSALLGALLIGVFLVGLLERRDRTILRMGWDSLLVMLLFAGGLVVLYAIQ